MGFLNLIFSSKSHKEKESSIEEVIKRYFDKHEWQYNMITDEDSIITFGLGFSGDYEKLLMLQVRVLPNSAIYQISCKSEIKLPQNCISNGIIAINNYNLRAHVVSGCINPEGDIIFWLERNIDGNAFSEQAFAADLDMVINMTDNETAHIYKQVQNPQS